MNKLNLEQPVPNTDEAKRLKTNYRSIPIDTSHPLFNEPLVPISDYNIAGQSYYSRPNAATITAIDQVPKAVYVRKSLAETLASINERLDNTEIEDFFHGSVELYAEEGTRLKKVQQALYEKYVPQLIRTQQPLLSDEEVLEVRNSLIAAPSTDALSPSPHATGGAIDVILRYKQPDLEYVANVEVPMGHFDGATVRTDPDYYEDSQEYHPLAKRNRRAFYACMTGIAFHTDTGLSVNPTEWWHWGRGDQLSAAVSGEPAYYSLAPVNER